MRIFVFIIALVVSSLSFAQAEDPTRFCEGQPECTDRIRGIIQNYSQGKATFANEDLSAFSGACYHISNHYNPNYEHYGAFLFEHSERGFLSDGIFSFFYESDPYQNMTPAEIRKKFTDNSSGRFAPAINFGTHIEVRFLGANYDIRYWFRNDDKLNKVYLLGRQMVGGGLAFVFCELGKR